MKIKDGYMLREVAGNYIVVPVGKASLDFSGMITLNQTGAYLWEKLEKECEEEEIIKNMLNDFDGEEKKMRADVNEFIEKLRGAELIE